MSMCIYYDFLCINARSLFPDTINNYFAYKFNIIVSLLRSKKCFKYEFHSTRTIQIYILFEFIFKQITIKVKSK